MRRRISWLVLATTSTVVVVVRGPALPAGADPRRGPGHGRGRPGGPQRRDPGRRLGDEASARRGRRRTRPRAATPSTGVLTADGTVLGAGRGDADDPEVRRARGGRGVHRGRRRRRTGAAAGGHRRRARRSCAPASPPDDLRRGVTGAWLGIIGLGVAAAGAGARRSPRGWAAASASRCCDVAGSPTSSARATCPRGPRSRGTEETEELARALNGLAERTTRAAGGGAGRGRGPLPPAAHPGHRAAAGRRGGRPTPTSATRLQDHIGVLQRSIDAIVQEARRPVRTRPRRRPATPSAVVRERVELLAGARRGPGPADRRRAPRPVRCRCRSPPTTWPTSSTSWSTTSSRTPPEPAAFAVRLDRRSTARSGWSSRTRVPGSGVARRRRDRARTGLGLDIARRTAAACGGRSTFGPRRGGGTRVEVILPLLRRLSAGSVVVTVVVAVVVATVRPVVGRRGAPSSSSSSWSSSPSSPSSPSPPWCPSSSIVVVAGPVVVAGVPAVVRPSGSGDRGGARGPRRGSAVAGRRHHDGADHGRSRSAGLAARPAACRGRSAAARPAGACCGRLDRARWLGRGGFRARTTW